MRYAVLRPTSYAFIEQQSDEALRRRRRQVGGKTGPQQHLDPGAAKSTRTMLDRCEHLTPLCGHESGKNRMKFIKRSASDEAIS